MLEIHQTAEAHKPLLGNLRAYLGVRWDLEEGSAYLIRHGIKGLLEPQAARGFCQEKGDRRTWTLCCPAISASMTLW